jgi:hypothetical protein
VQNCGRKVQKNYQEHNMNQILVPLLSLEQWKIYLADPEKHWKTGYSAKSLASCWYESDEFPRSIKEVFNKSGKPFINLKPVMILAEHKVPLPGGRRSSQSDLWVLARNDKEMFSITVEGKVNETFDKTTKEWFEDETKGKRVRFEFLNQTLEIDIPSDSSIRYQLLHRAASAVIEAERFRTEHAMMIVHSFSPENAWFGDYEAFLSLWGFNPKKNTIYSTHLNKGIELHFAWIQGEAEYLNR